MKLDPSRWIVFAVLLGLNAVLAFATFVFGLQKELLAGHEMPSELANVPGWVLGLGNAGMIVVAYGIVGVIGLWLGQKAGLHGVYRPQAGLRGWVWMPMALGLIAMTLRGLGKDVTSLWPDELNPSVPQKPRSAKLFPKLIMMGWILLVIGLIVALWFAIAACIAAFKARILV